MTTDHYNHLSLLSVVIVYFCYYLLVFVLFMNIILIALVCHYALVCVVLKGKSDSSDAHVVSIVLAAARRKAGAGSTIE